MASISQKLKAREREEHIGLAVVTVETQGTCCWFCGEELRDEDYAETTVVVKGRLRWVPVCDSCCPPTLPPTPLAARLACPICDETLVPPRRHSCGGAAPVAPVAPVALASVSPSLTSPTHSQDEVSELVSNGRRH